MKFNIELKFELSSIPFSKFNLISPSDIFILPSCTEGFPHVIWEAAANCCPVITTNVGVIPKELKNHVDCTLIKSYKVDETVNAVTALIGNNRIRGELIYNAYKKAKKNSIEKCIDKLILEINNEIK